MQPLRCCIVIYNYVHENIKCIVFNVSMDTFSIYFFFQSLKLISNYSRQSSSSNCILLVSTYFYLLAKKVIATSYHHYIIDSA